MGKASRRKRDRKRTIALDPATAAELQAQIQRFREKFGREPDPEDPLFFDPDADTPMPLPLDAVKQEIVAAMAQTGIAPEIIYAFEKTGLIRSETNQDKMLPEDREAWDDAVEEYRDLEKRNPKQ